MVINLFQTFPTKQHGSDLTMSCIQVLTLYQTPETRTENIQALGYLYDDNNGGQMIVR